MSTLAPRIAGNAATGRICVILSATLLVFLFGTNIYRARTQSITADEARTYNHFVSVPYGQFTSQSGYNNHPLNTMLAKVSVGVFGASDFTLRLPSVLGGLLYFVALFRLGRLLFGDSPLLLLMVALNGLNPFVLDHLSAARGYGMGLAFWTLGALYVAQWSSRGSAGGTRLLVKAGIAFGLAVGSHMSEAFAVTATGASLMAICFAEALAGGPRNAARFLWRAMVPLAGATAVVALPLVWTPLRIGDAVDGAAQFRAAIETLPHILLFYKPTVLTSWPGAWKVLYEAAWFGMLAAFALLAVSVATILYRWWRAGGRDRSDEADRQALLFFGAVLVTFFLLWLEPRVMRHAFFWQRRLLFTFPVLFVAAPLWVRWVWRQFPRVRVAGVVCALPLILLAAHFALQFNTAWYWGWEFDAGTKRMARLLRNKRPAGAARPVRVGADWRLSDTLDYYRIVYRMDWMAPVTREPAACYYDFYAVSEADLPTLRPFSVVPILRDSVSKMVLAEADPAPRQRRLADLREAGFSDLPPCRADIDIDRSWMELGRPGAARHVLLDLLCDADTEAACWTVERPTLLFRVPRAGKRIFRMDLAIHSVTLHDTGPVLLTLWVNGKRIGERRYDAPGQHRIEQEVTGEAPRPGGLAVVQTVLDRYFVAKDGQKLGYQLLRAGFVE